MDIHFINKPKFLRGQGAPLFKVELNERANEPFTEREAEVAARLQWHLAHSCP